MFAVAYERVSFSYGKGEDGKERLALEDVSLTVREGERLGILGPNGGGKSTLLKLTLGLLEGHQGAIRVFDMPPAEARRKRLIGYVAQRVEAELAFPLSARQVVELGAAFSISPFRGLSQAEKSAVDDALSVVGATSYADKHVGTLSGGMLQRVLIARSLAAKPRLLMLDEPTVGIDPAGQQQFAELIVKLSREMGLTIIVVSHDLRTIAAGCDRVACLSRTLHSHVAPEGLTPGVLAEVFRHDVAAIFGDLHVDAHSAANCNDPTHAHGPRSGSVGLTIEGKK
jgi:zinc transport system ATP-binding protein